MQPRRATPDVRSKLRQIASDGALAAGHRDGEAVFGSLQFFYSMGWKVEELEKNPRSFCSTDSAKMWRRLDGHHTRGTLLSVCGAVLTMQRRLCERNLYIADAHTHDHCRPYAEGHACQGDRLKHAPLAYALAHKLAGDGPGEWTAVLERAQEKCHQEHAALRDGAQPGYNCAYLELGGLHEALLAGGLYKSDAKHAALELRHFTGDLAMFSVSTPEHGLRSSCMFGDASSDRQGLGHFNSPCGSEYGTIHVLQQTINTALSEIEQVTSCKGSTTLTSPIHSPRSLTQVSLSSWQVLQSREPFTIIAGPGTKDDGRSFTIELEVTEPYDKDKAIPSSTTSTKGDGVPDLLMAGSLGNAVHAVLKCFGNFNPAYNTFAGMDFPEVLLPGSQGLKASPYCG